MIIDIREQAFDPLNEIRQVVATQPSLRGKYGANAIFIGTMRDFNEGDHVESMVLEHYPGMTEMELGRIVDECVAPTPVLEVLVIHRVGQILPGDDIVLVSVWSAHRAAAFSACRNIMEALKTHAPFWKKERLSHGERWVSGNTPGDDCTPE
ncbi:MAG: molybdenum cofactor biosynthesis protein MoaE [marine bacterium B5-7]|nr:MAG: molybdenum cofactor biosynthesis protein MoaE [marine bacterium B5-7]